MVLLLLLLLLLSPAAAAAAARGVTGEGEEEGERGGVLATIIFSFLVF